MQEKAPIPVSVKIGNLRDRRFQIGAHTRCASLQVYALVVPTVGVQVSFRASTSRWERSLVTTLANAALPDKVEIVGTDCHLTRCGSCRF